MFSCLGKPHMFPKLLTFFHLFIILFHFLELLLQSSKLYLDVKIINQIKCLDRLLYKYQNRPKSPMLFQFEALENVLKILCGQGQNLLLLLQGSPQKSKTKYFLRTIALSQYPKYCYCLNYLKPLLFKKHIESICTVQCSKVGQHISYSFCTFLWYELFSKHVM